MKKKILLVLMAIFLIPTKVQAEEIHTAKATAYCITGKTATGTQTVEGRTVASKREWFGCTMVIWEDTGDHKIHPENYLGTYEVEDTGGDTIKEGWVIDVYIADYDRAINYGAKDIIFQIIKGDG